VHGRDYLFSTPEAVEAMIRGGELLEHARYVTHIYGTPEGPVDAALAAGQDAILEIETQGALQVKARRPGAVMVFIAPPGFDELERRLRGRGTESVDTVAARLDAARREYAEVAAFDYIVINDQVDAAADELRAIILSQRCRAAKRLSLLLTPFGATPTGQERTSETHAVSLHE
jgi:guanylate kinase